MGLLEGMVFYGIYSCYGIVTKWVPYKMNGGERT